MSRLERRISAAADSARRSRFRKPQQKRESAAGRQRPEKADGRSQLIIRISQAQSFRMAACWSYLQPDATWTPGAGRVRSESGKRRVPSHAFGLITLPAVVGEDGAVVTVSRPRPGNSANAAGMYVRRRIVGAAGGMRHRGCHSLTVGRSVTGFCPVPGKALFLPPAPSPSNRAGRLGYA